jgi:hypothetical protein
MPIFIYKGETVPITAPKPVLPKLRLFKYVLSAALFFTMFYLAALPGFAQTIPLPTAVPITSPMPSPTMDCGGPCAGDGVLSPEVRPTPVDMFANCKGTNKQQLTCMDKILSAASAKANNKYISENGITGVYAAFIRKRGIPCHTSTYTTQSAYYVSYWYCNADNIQNENYTFRNGILFSHYEAGP